MAGDPPQLNYFPYPLLCYYQGIIIPHKTDRAEKLEQLLFEVKYLLEHSIFLLGADKIRKLVKELEVNNVKEVDGSSGDGSDG